VSSPIPFIIFKSHYDFRQTNIITELIDPGVGGFSEVIKSRMVIPFDGSWLRFKKVITHELVHVFTYAVLYSEGLESMLSASAIPPMWFMEGLAEFETREFDPIGHMMLVDAVVENRIDPLENLTDFGMTGNVFLAYQESHSLLRYIAQTYGEEKVSMLLRKFKKSAGLEGTIKQSLGVDIKTLETGWIKSLRQAYYPEVARRRIASDDSQQIFKDQVIPAAPSFSPGGDLAAVTIIKDGILCIALIKTSDGTIVKYITEGMRGIKFEDLSFEAGPAYSKDGSRIAFIAKCKNKDVIFLFDVFNNKLLKTIKVDLDNISSLCFAQANDNIILSGLKNGESNIYRFNIPTKGLEKITHGMDRQPAYSSAGNKIAFIREQGTATDLCVLNMDTAEVTRLALPDLPKMDPFWSQDGNIVYCSCLLNKTYNIWAVRLQENPMNGVTTNAQVTDYFGGAFNGGYMGDKLSFSSYEKGGNAVYFHEKPLNIVWIQPEIKDSTTANIAASLAIKKTDGNITPYKTRLTFDWRRMDMLYSSANGFAGIGELAMSDVLGNHRFIWRGDASSSIEGDTNFILAYLYLGKRASYEVDISDWSNSYRFLDEESKEKKYGISGNVSYPLDIFRRVEFGLSSKRVVTNYILHKSPTVRENINLVSADIIHDTTVWSWDGPIGGSRARIGISDTIGLSNNDLDFTNLEIDLRKYIKAGNRSAMAFQLSGKTSTGRDQTQFILGNGGIIVANENGRIKRYFVDEFRGGTELRGKAFAKGSFEFRFPLIDTIQFSLPMSIRNIRSLVFFDVGAAWQEGKPPVFRKAITENNIRGAFGWGIRSNLWIFPIRIDYARGTDFINSTSGAVTHFSLGYDF
ncbi:BamA/TamA family outer membrane protein, partial [Candidatus Desantisbacteria bacterium]|nr:BamA/TamA family outer membrane protein [Candidatus Desantisbacteria bacterium]